MSSLWTPALGVAASKIGKPLTFDEWLDLAEDEPGELVAGHLEEEEVPDAVHELAVSWLIALFRSWLGSDGFVLGSDVKLAISPTSGRKADVVVYMPEGQVPPRRGALREPPDLVVEVVTPTPRDERRDRVEKMTDYAGFGVRHYWLLDPALGAFEAFSLDDAGRYVKALGCTGGCVEDIPGCPGLTLDLDALWQELARLGPESAQ